jgi:ribonuclease T2
MLAFMPDAGLIQHEWRTHGSCSGLSAEEYFTEVKRAAEKVRIQNCIGLYTMRLRLVRVTSNEDLQV